MQFCRSLESGVITMNNEIIGKINAQYDMMVDDELISDVLLGRETILPQEVQNTIREAAKTHAKDILDQLRELGVDLRHQPRHFHRWGQQSVPAPVRRFPHGGQSGLCGGPQSQRHWV